MRDGYVRQWSRLVTVGSCRGRVLACVPARRTPAHQGFGSLTLAQKIWICAGFSRSVVDDQITCRRRSRAVASRFITVPIGTSSISAVSL